MKKEYAVIGLGRFGGSICKALSEEGLEVMAMDMNEDRVNEYAKIASHAVIGDSTDESVLKISAFAILIMSSLRLVKTFRPVF